MLNSILTSETTSLMEVRRSRQVHFCNRDDHNQSAWALVGGVISVALGEGVISVASMVGFITLFSVATRNGLLLVDNNKLADAIALGKVLVDGSLERLVAILMTALSSALGMVPLVIGTGAGKEILQPLAVVLLGGLFTSTALTLLVLPALYSQFGRFLIPKQRMPVQGQNIEESVQGSVL